MLSPFPYLNAYSKFRKERFRTGGVTDPTTPIVILGMSFAVFILVMLLTIIIWFWALIALIYYWKKLPLFAQVIGLLGLFTTLSPLTTLVAVYSLHKP
jgi:nucleoside permease NupC